MKKIIVMEIYIQYLDYHIKLKEMHMDKKLFQKAMELPVNERVTLAELILESIDYEEKEIKEAWTIEVKDRIASVNKGDSTLIDFEKKYIES